MELPELQEGLQNIEQDATASDAIDLPPETETSPVSEAPWELNADSMRNTFGAWYGNDDRLGEMFLAQLRAHGVDTKAATEAMLRELLSGLVGDINLLQSKLSGFISELSKQSQKTQAVVDSVQAAIDNQNPDAVALNINPPSAAMPQFNDLNIDSGMNGEMPPDTGAGAGEMPPDTGAGAGEMPPDTGAGAGEMPPDTGAGLPPEEKPSDRRIKNVLSDERLKKIKAKLLSNRKPKGKNISSNIIAACSKGF